MQPKKSDRQRSFICPVLRNHLLGLGKVISCQVFEDSFRVFYAASGRPGKPVRLKLGLLIHKQLKNLSYKRVVEAWVHNSYFQAYCDRQRFTWKLPCDPSEPTYFRHRIRQDGVLKIFADTVALHGDKAKEAEVGADSTFQNLNITFLTGTNLLNKCAKRRHTITKLKDVKILWSYQRFKSLPRTIRFKSNGRWQREAQRTVRRLCTIVGILIRDLKPKLSSVALVIQQQALDLYTRVQRQQLTDTGKIYSLYEPKVACIIKDKAHKKYEFGAKASKIVTKISGLIVGALSFQDNPFYGHRLPTVLPQGESIVWPRPTM